VDYWLSQGWRRESSWKSLGAYISNRHKPPTRPPNKRTKKRKELFIPSGLRIAKIIPSAAKRPIVTPRHPGTYFFISSRIQYSKDHHFRYKHFLTLFLSGSVEQLHGRYFTHLVNRVDYRHALPILHITSTYRADGVGLYGDACCIEKSPYG